MEYIETMMGRLHKVDCTNLEDFSEAWADDTGRICLGRLTNIKRKTFKYTPSTEFKYNAQIFLLEQQLCRLPNANWLYQNIKQQKRLKKKVLKNKKFNFVVYLKTILECCFIRLKKGRLK